MIKQHCLCGLAIVSLVTLVGCGPSEESRAATKQELQRWTSTVDSKWREPLLAAVSNGGADGLAHLLTLRFGRKNLEAFQWVTQHRSAFSDMVSEYEAASKGIRELPLPTGFKPDELEKARSFRDDVAQSCEEDATAYRSLVSVEKNSFQAGLTSFDTHFNQSDALQKRAHQEEQAL